MSLTQSSAATPTQTIMLSPVTSTNILTSSSLISSAQSNQLSTIFISSTKLSKATTASFSQSVATTIKRTSFSEFTQLLSSSLSQSQLTSQTHQNYLHTYAFMLTKSSTQSMLNYSNAKLKSKVTSLSTNSLTLCSELGTSTTNDLDYLTMERLVTEVQPAAVDAMTVVGSLMS